MTFEWLVALRYLRSPNRPVVLRIVTLLAIVGVAAGVTTLVIALSMNTGFRQAIRDRLLSVTAHINLKPIGPNGIPDYRPLISELSAAPGVRSIEPAIYATVLLSSGGHARGIVLKGVDPQLELQASEALHQIEAGSANFAPDADGIPAVLVGYMLANDLEISAGDYVTLTSPQGNLTPLGMMPRSRRFRVTGIFNSGFYDYDANWGFVNLPSAQSLSGTEYSRGTDHDRNGSGAGCRGADGHGRAPAANPKSLYPAGVGGQHRRNGFGPDPRLQLCGNCE